MFLMDSNLDGYPHRQFSNSQVTLVLKIVESPHLDSSSARHGWTRAPILFEQIAVDLLLARSKFEVVQFQVLVRV